MLEDVSCGARILCNFSHSILKASNEYGSKTAEETGIDTRREEKEIET
jgi:hypothetical protein